LCHPGDIFCHHQNPSLGGSGSARPPRNALARSRHLPLWPPPSAGPHKWAWAFDQHIFADARSASLRKLGLWLVSELSPLGKMGLAWRPSEGRALHDRQGTPCPTVAFPPLATAFGPTAQMGLGIRPTYFHGRAERIPPQTIFGPTNIPCAFPARPHARGWPLGGSGSARPPRNTLPDPGISPFGHRLWLDRLGGHALHDRTNGPRHPTDKCSRTRGAHPSANDIRAN